MPMPVVTTALYIYCAINAEIISIAAIDAYERRFQPAIPNGAMPSVVIQIDIVAG